MEIKIGDWVTLDYKNYDNRNYHEYRSEQFGLEPDKEYEVVDIGTSSKKPLLTLATPERLRAFDGALHDRLKALVGDVHVDLDEPLSPDDE